MNEPNQMEDKMFFPEARTENLCFSDESDTDRKVVVLSEYKNKTGKSGCYYSPVPGFLSPDLEIKVLRGPEHLFKKELVVRVELIDFLPEKKQLQIYVCNNEENREIKEFLNLKIKRIFVSSLMGCRKFEGIVKLEENIEWDAASVFVFDVLSTDYNFGVTFYRGELVTINFEGVR